MMQPMNVNSNNNYLTGLNAVERPEVNPLTALEHEGEEENLDEATPFISSVVYKLTVGRVRIVREYPLKIDYDTVVGGNEQMLARNVATQTDDKYIHEHIENLCREIFAKWNITNEKGEIQIGHDRNPDMTLQPRSVDKVTKPQSKQQAAPTENVYPAVKSESLEK